MISGEVTGTGYERRMYITKSWTLPKHLRIEDKKREILKNKILKKAAMISHYSGELFHIQYASIALRWSRI